MYNFENVRVLDNHGRIVIPVKLRKELNIVIGDQLELALDGNMIIINPTKHKCVFCSEKTTHRFMDKYICEECVVKLKEE